MAITDSGEWVQREHRELAVVYSQLSDDVHEAASNGAISEAVEDKWQSTRDSFDELTANMYPEHELVWFVMVPTWGDELRHFRQEATDMIATLKRAGVDLDTPDVAPPEKPPLERAADTAIDLVKAASFGLVAVAAVVLVGSFRH